jgi:CO/xanthine dehydrogenase Mo-binding subunit
MPRSTDVPLDMESYVIEIPQGPGPFGAIGMGEAAHFPMAGAIISAIHEATGIWFNEIPITPQKVLAALAEKNK